MENMSFGEALTSLKAGKKVARRGWNKQGMFLAIQNPDENSANRQSYIYIVPFEGGRVPWVASQPDLLEEDWFELDGVGCRLNAAHFYLFFKFYGINKRNF